MERTGLADSTYKGGGRSGDPLLMNESSSLRRTAKARAHAAQYLMNDIDNTCMLLLPDDPEKRISLHRQLRGRYNPTQIPLSSLSCAAYLSAGNVAQLAALFRQYNVFTSEVVNTFDMDDSSGSRSGSGKSNSEGKGKMAVTEAAPATTAKAPNSRLHSAVRHRGSTPKPPSQVSSTKTAAPRSPVVLDPLHGKTGMGVLRSIAQQCPPPALHSIRASSFASPCAAGDRATATGTAVATPFSELPTMRRAREPLAGATMETVVADRRELAEPFTSERNDAALTTAWLVELLLEMVIENFARSANIGVGGGGAAPAATGTASGQPPMPSAGSLSQPQPATDSQHPYNTANGTHVSQMCFSSPTIFCQTRHRDARVDQLRHFKEELSAWAMSLDQKCDEREHQAVWYQCAAQDEVLQRYQACVLQNQALRQVGASLTGVPGGTAGAMSSCPKTLSFVNFESSGTLVHNKADSNAPLRRNGGAGGRSSVSWGLPHVIDIASPDVATTSKTRGTRCSSPVASAAKPTTPSGDAQLNTLPEALPQRQPDIGANSDTTDPDELLSTHSSDKGDTLAQTSTPVQRLHSPNSSLPGSAAPLPSDTTGCDAGVAHPSTNVSATGVGGTVAERNLLAAKSWLTAPALKDLLQQPAQLYMYLWSSCTGARPAEEAEEAEEKHQHHEGVRMVRGGDKLPRRSSVVHTERPLGARRSRAATVQHLVCWSDVASNLVMGLETTWLSERHETSYARVPTALLEDLSETAAPKRGGPGGHIGAGGDVQTVPHSFTGTQEDGSNDDSDSLDDGAGVGGGAGSGAGAGGNGQACRRRLRKSGLGSDAAALQQSAVLFNNLDKAAEITLGTLHSEAADHILVSPTGRYAVTSSKDGFLKVWDTTSGQFVSTILNVGQSWVLTLTFLHGGECLLVATSSAEITVVNFPAGGVLLKLRGCTSRATAVPQVKQPSTFFTKRYGLRPGECGQHKPTRSDGGGLLGAAAAAQLMECAEGESALIVARPIVGYVTPTAAFYDAEMGFFFFGTMSGMIGCVDLTAVLSRTALHAAAAGAGWSYPLQVYDSVFAHPEALLSEKGTAPATTSELLLPSPDSTVTHSHLPSIGHRKAQTMPPSSSAPAGMSASTSGGGVPVNRLFYCGVGHCIISSDSDGGIVRTSFTTAADTLDCALGTPAVVMTTAKPIRFMVSCSSGRRFVTVHSDRRAFLWAVGRTLTECVHQYPQEAYDIIDVCFMQPHQQVALLMADHSIRIYDERGSRPLTSILPPRGLSSRVEDMASMTLKCSANDVDGCLAYLPSTQRLVCGLRGPVLYERVTRAPARSGTSPRIVKDLEIPVSTDVPEEEKSNPTEAAPASLPAGMRVDELQSPPSSLSPLQMHKSVLPFSTATSTSPAATQATTLSLRRSRIASASAPMGTSAYDEVRDLVGDTVSTEAEKAKAAAAAVMEEELRCQHRLHAALHKCRERLSPHQTHSSAVIGLLLDPGRGELHSFSTDTWCVWHYETGKRLRAPLHVPRAAEKELAVHSRRALLTCCGWSTERRTRVLVGTRDSRVLTLDAHLGSVMSTTDPFTESSKGPTAGASSPMLLADKDVSAIASAGSRTLLCSGNVCEVRRYEVASVPKPSGEENFISMRVELSSSTAAAAPSPTHGGGAVATVAHTTAITKDMKGTTSATRGSCSDTTITACCVVRESHLCLGTADTQLFFYRMVDRSSPVHIEVLCDAHGVPDVGHVVSLNYLYDVAQDILLAVVDTGILFLYSYTLQRTLGRHTFPILGTRSYFTASPNFTSRGCTGGPPQQEHYITSVALTREVVGAPQLSLLMMACGDSAGYVHVVPLAHLLAEVVGSTSCGRGASSGGRAAKNHELRVSAFFRASRGGVSSLELLAINSSKPTVSVPSQVTRELLATERTTAATSTAVLPTAPFSEPHLLVFAAGFDGNVRVFSLCPSTPQQQDLTVPPFALSTSTSTCLGAMMPLQLPQCIATGVNYTKASHSRGAVPGLAGDNFSFQTVGDGRTSLLNNTVGVVLYEVTTVGLCGVDTWELFNPSTFSDIEQAAAITQAGKDGYTGVVLPSIVDDVDDSKSAAEGYGVAAGAASAPGERTTTAAVASETAAKESGAMLLYDILRRSKKQKPGSPTTTAGTNAQQPLHQPRLAAATTVTAEDEAALRQCGSASRSRLSPSLPSMRVDASAARAAVSNTRAVAAWSKKRDAGTNGGPARYPGCCTSVAPPPQPRPPPPPMHFTPHTISELVRDALPSSWSRSSAMTNTAATSSLPLDLPMYDVAGCVGDDQSHGVLSPIPHPQATRNPLVRLYPRPLLRQMGLLHPLDTAPDVDPETGLVVLIPVHEAFKLWETRVLGTETTNTATAAPNLLSTSLIASGTPVQPELAMAEVSAPLSVSDTSGTDATINAPRCAHTLSPSHSLEARGLRCPDRTTEIGCPAPPSLPLDQTRSAGEEVDALRGCRNTRAIETEPETSVFLTEGGADWTRQRLHTATPVSFLCASVRDLGTTTVAREPSFASHRTMIDEKTSASGADGSQRVTICASFTTEWKTVPDTLRDTGNASSKRSASCASPSSARAWSSRSRHPLPPPAPTTPAQCLATQKITYLRDALTGVDAEVLRMREDQMMLGHMAARLDRLRQVPPPAHGSTTSPTECTVIHSFAAENMGTHTSPVSAASSSMPHTAAVRTRELKLDGGSAPHREWMASGKGAPGRVVLPHQRRPTVMMPSLRSEWRSRHGGQSNLPAAYASVLHASASTTFGLELLALSLPSEPQWPSTRGQHRTGRGANASLSARAATAHSSREGRATMPALAATAPLSKIVPHVATGLPMIAVQQEVQPIRVCLPSTLRADEGERMWLRRFEAAFNSIDK
ncbi:hypothetical protein, conserved [Leishmania tarentolae]|uniref:Guanine nucleotide-binding protein subunit beta-like protein n=1 Tax=Leishmania tarentolae TaxID=5689 RepID=A0A640KIX0_LEITA|nr:hypothetical protein, conserved [Leishmania tarentolae]